MTGNFVDNGHFHVIVGIFYVLQISRHRTDGFTSLPKEGMLKNPTASAGFETANLGTRGQHDTPRPSKPLKYGFEWCLIPFVW
jgi:hypothetical protein